MKKFFLIFLWPALMGAQVPQLTDEVAVKLSQKPLNCINTEYPNKTAHIINNGAEAQLTPSQLHPAFYGCLDWHSAVHGHWMLVKLLKNKPFLSNAAAIEKMLDESLQKEKLQREADYFNVYKLTNTFERTYGWAWLLKLDEELSSWDHPKAKIWHQNMKPLTDQIVSLWQNYLPKQTYPNRTGVHPNSAFALGFAIDWAKATGNVKLETEFKAKALKFYYEDQKTPAYLEPDGSDFFSPSLEIADLMARILPEREFSRWLNRFYDRRSIKNISTIPVVSDINDFQTVHLVGLSFSRAWCMKNIARKLLENHRLKKQFDETSNKFLNHALPLLFQGNYGGDHWLASFAVYALDQ